VTERGYSVSDVASRLGVSTRSLYDWIHATRKTGAPVNTQAQDSAAEIRRLKSELRRVTEERDILKKARAYFAEQSG